MCKMLKTFSNYIGDTSQSFFRNIQVLLSHSPWRRSKCWSVFELKAENNYCRKSNNCELECNCLLCESRFCPWCFYPVPQDYPLETELFFFSESDDMRSSMIKAYNLSRIINERLNGYDRKVRPNAGGPPVIVKIEFKVISFGEIKEANMVSLSIVEKFSNSVGAFET